jgi:predicted aldo/keto reductase-like oxidoreductase
MNINEYLDPQSGILDYLLEQKRNGRIRHLGFSCHGETDVLKRFLDAYGEHMEFCQIQLNWLDWTLQGGKEKVDILTGRGIPIVVMEPLRGGKLASLSEEETDVLRAFRPEETPAAWGFRFLQGIPNVHVVLSGMSALEQMDENIRTFSVDRPLSPEETRFLLDLAEQKKDAVPCTACRYCTEGCPMELDIPMLIAAYNDCKFSSSFTVPMQMDALDEDKRPSACIGCGACAAICPQNIDIPSVLADFADMYDKSEKWADICKRREEEARRLKEGK